MKLTGPQIQELHNAIVDAFSLEDLIQLVRFRLGVDLGKIVNLDAPFRNIVFNLIMYCDHSGLTEQLINAVGRGRPANPQIRAALEHVGAATDTDELERVVRQDLPFADIQVLRTRLGELERCVCRVQVGPEDSPEFFATGFLVGPDLVITCYHAIEQLTKQSPSPRIQFLFDHNIASSGLESASGVVYKSQPTHGLLARSSWDVRDEEGLDYVLIQLDRPVEPERGYIRFPAMWPPISPGMPLFIIQHPKGGPLKLAIGSNGVSGISRDRRFIHHRVKTEPGSAGSPVFNADWDLIGMHQRREKDEKVAIAMAAIAEDLVRKGVDLTGRQVPLSAQAASASPSAEVSQRLRDYRPLAEPPAEPEEPPALEGYRKAAAVLDSFDVGKLRPLPPAEPDELALIRLVSECSLRTDPERGPRYALNAEARRAILAKMSGGDIRRALKLNREFPEDQRQRPFSAVVLDEPMPEIGPDVQRLRDLLQAVTLLRGKIHDLPDEQRLRQRIAIEELLEPHRHLAGRDFRGRGYELMRLGALLDGESTEPLLVHGIGGSGKSALIARFLLDRHRGADAMTPFVFLDCDRPEVVAEEPITLATEAVRQLGAQFPELADEAARCIARWENLLDRARAPRPSSRDPSQRRSLARYSIGAKDREKIRREFLRFLRRVLLPGDRLLFALDTFEEVQRTSREAVDRVWEFLERLRADVPGVRVVVSGRADLTDRPVDSLPLGDLDAEAAQEMIEAGGVPASIAAKVVQVVGGNPLCLRMALQVLNREGPEAFAGLAAEDSAVSGEIRSQVVQGFLYKRILQHLDDKEVEKLAFPGLTVRRIDERVIREVLAGPCGLSVPDDETALDLFNRLAREVALVQPGKAGALYHRQDVRRIMLGLLRTESRGQFDAINRKAVEFYSAQNAGKPTPDPAARAEEIYHRLALGESPAAVAPLWVDGVEDFLRSSVEDFTDAEPATFLASRLGVEVPSGLWDKARTGDWELQTAKRAEDLIKLNNPEKALKVIHSRAGQPLPGSPLYLLEARVRLLQGDTVGAASVARAGILSAAAAGKHLAQFNLLVFLAEVLSHDGDGASARAALEEALAIPIQVTGPLRGIDALVRFLRLGRALGVPATDDAAWRTDLGLRLKRLPPSLVPSYPKLMHHAAVEVLPEDREAHLYISKLIGVDQAVTIDPNYGNREGYDPDFLGSDAQSVPLPKMTAAMRARAAVSVRATGATNSHELRYHHFSIVMDRTRRVAIFAAVNIDGRLAGPPTRDPDQWIFDPRIPDEFQIDTDLFQATGLERAHLVRHPDPAWGDNTATRRDAHDDAFHFTNCVPLPVSFNKDKSLWSGLEDLLLQNACDESKRMTIFTGPIFTPEDPVIRQFQVPKRYWKIAVSRRKNGSMVATGYIVNQEELLRAMMTERSSKAKERLFQVRVHTIEQATGLDFGSLRKCDAASAVEAFAEAEGGKRELDSYKDIVLA